MTTRGAGRPPGRGGQRGGGALVPPWPGSQGSREPKGPRGPLSYPRALAIVVVAVALGAYLLSIGPGHGAAAPPPTTTPTTAPPASTTTTTAPGKSGSAATKPSTAVKVLVANASETNGVAGYYTSQLASAGWGTLTAVTADTVETTSSVYYASGQQANAEAVASELHVASSAVQPLGSTVPLSSTTGADVVVIAGEDLAAKVPTTTTTTAS